MKKIIALIALLIITGCASDECIKCESLNDNYTCTSVCGQWEE